MPYRKRSQIQPRYAKTVAKCRIYAKTAAESRKYSRDTQRPWKAAYTTEIRKGCGKPLICKDGRAYCAAAPLFLTGSKVF